ncbi:MAG: DNA translocase FtsK 4TM domain-containing protein, partial [Ferruginibacter sp.]
MSAAKSKPVKKTKKSEANLPPEKEEKVEVKVLLKDERTHKIAGSVAILLSILFFIAFTSYCFTWEEDQDKVFREGQKLLIGTDTKVANLMGTFGAYISHLFIYKGFGIASFLLCSLFFVIGVNLFFGRKVFSVFRNLKYLVVGLPLLSITAAVIMGGQSFPWGGAFGDFSKDYLYKTIGTIGTIAIIGVSFLAYIIWRFNPSFNFSAKKEDPYISTYPQSILPEEYKQPGDEMEVVVAAGNGMKQNGAMREIPDQNPVFNHDLEIKEREDEVDEEDEEE